MRHLVSFTVWINTTFSKMTPTAATSWNGFIKLFILVVMVFRFSAEERGSRRSQLSGRRDIDERETFLRVTTILVEPYLMIRENKRNSTGNDRYEGYIVDLLDAITHKFGLKYKLLPLDDGRYGNRNKDGTWDGMIGQLMSQEADLAAAPMYITKARSDVVDFTRPYLRVRATILTKRPPTGKPSSILSVNDLVSQSYIQYGTLDSGMIKGAFRTSNDTQYQRMWQDMKTVHPTVFTKSNEAGIQRVRESGGRYAFILPTTIGDYIARKNPCDLITVDRFLMERGFGLATPKSSGLLRQLDRILEELDAGGFLQKIYEKWWIKKNDCNGIHSSSLKSRGQRVHCGRHVVFLITILLACLILQ